MTVEMTNIILLSAYFLTLSAVGEIAYRYFHVNAEITRKWSHIGSGLLALLFPAYLHSLGWVASICALFLVILYVSKPLGLLPSIHQVKRQTYGSLLFPVAVFLSFWSFQTKGNDLVFFYLPVLTLAVCDLAAALLGQKYPLRKIQIYAASKSWGGLLAFLISSLILNLLMYHAGFQLSIASIVCIPVLTSLVECMTPKGFDNLTIPATVILLLQLLNS